MAVQQVIIYTDELYRVEKSMHSLPALCLSSVARCSLCSEQYEKNHKCSSGMKHMHVLVRVSPLLSVIATKRNFATVEITFCITWPS